MTTSRNASTRVATVASLIAALALAGALTACNTVAGAGQDVGSVGHGVTSGADAVKNSM